MGVKNESDSNFVNREDFLKLQNWDIGQSSVIALLTFGFVVGAYCINRLWRYMAKLKNKFSTEALENEPVNFKYGLRGSINVSLKDKTRESMRSILDETSNIKDINVDLKRSMGGDFYGSDDFLQDVDNDSVHESESSTIKNINEADMFIGTTTNSMDERNLCITEQGVSGKSGVKSSNSFVHKDRSKIGSGDVDGSATEVIKKKKLALDKNKESNDLPGSEGSDAESEKKFVAEKMHKGFAGCSASKVNASEEGSRLLGDCSDDSDVKKATRKNIEDAVVRSYYKGFDCAQAPACVLSKPDLSKPSHASEKYNASVH